MNIWLEHGQACTHELCKGHVLGVERQEYPHANPRCQRTDTSLSLNFPKRPIITYCSHPLRLSHSQAPPTLQQQGRARQLECIRPPEQAAAPAQVCASRNHRFLPPFRSSMAGYPRFLRAGPTPSITRSWILQRSWKAASTQVQAGKGSNGGYVEPQRASWTRWKVQAGLCPAWA